jgi:hypothetical protein
VRFNWIAKLSGREPRQNFRVSRKLTAELITNFGWLLTQAIMVLAIQTITMLPWTISVCSQPPSPSHSSQHIENINNSARKLFYIFNKPADGPHSFSRCFMMAMLFMRSKGEIYVSMHHLWSCRCFHGALGRSTHFRHDFNNYFCHMERRGRHMSGYFIIAIISSAKKQRVSERPHGVGWSDCILSQNNWFYVLETEIKRNWRRKHYRKKREKILPQTASQW